MLHVLRISYLLHLDYYKNRAGGRIDAYLHVTFIKYPFLQTSVCLVMVGHRIFMNENRNISIQFHNAYMILLPALLCPALNYT
jgi:hypothetical protein